MKLKTLINLKFSAINSDSILIRWKTEEELLEYNTNLVKSFEDSDESVIGSKALTDIILSMKDRIKSYQHDKNSIEKNLEFLRTFQSSTTDQVEYDRVKNIIFKKIENEKNKEGNPYIELTKDELYDILSLQTYREKQLDKLK